MAKFLKKNAAICMAVIILSLFIMSLTLMSVFAESSSVPPGYSDGAPNATINVPKNGGVIKFANSTGVILDIDSKKLPNGVTSVKFDVTAIPDSEPLYKNAIQAILKKYPDFTVNAVFNLNLLDQNGKNITNFNGSITGAIPIPLKGKANAVAYFDEKTGTLVIMPSRVKNGFVEFKTNHFSYYLLVEVPAYLIPPFESVTAPESSKPVKNPFSDLKDSAWYYDGAMYCYTYGLMKGTSTEMFSPEMSLTRGTIATVLYRQAGEPDVSMLENAFDDVAAGEWYEAAVKWASANGIMIGHGDGVFKPNDYVTREQLATILYRLEDSWKVDISDTLDKEWSDFDSVSEYAKNAVEKLTMQGIFQDIPVNADNEFEPQSEATRAEIAVMMHRFFEAASK